MKKILTILILITSLNGFSQNFAPPGATWHYNISSVWLDGFIKITQVGDTVIQGVQAQKLEMRSSYTFWESGQTFYDVFAGFEYTYVDQDRVYQLIGDEFEILYDFTVQANDTIIIYNHEFTEIIPECDAIARAIVTATGTENVNGLELRWYEVFSLDESTFYLNGKIIERMGNITGYLFGQPSDCFGIIEGYINGLRCYEDDNFPQYKPYSGECDFINGIEERENNRNSFHFYPNPTKNKLVIEISESIKVEKISIYTIDGKFVLEIPISNYQFEIDISELQSGLYLLEVETEDGFREIKQFIVE